MKKITPLVIKRERKKERERERERDGLYELLSPFLLILSSIISFILILLLYVLVLKWDFGDQFLVLLWWVLLAVLFVRQLII